MTVGWRRRGVLLCPWALAAFALPAVSGAQPVNGPVPAPAAPEVEPAAVSMRPGFGITLRTRDGRFSLNLRSRVQVRETVVLPPTGPATNELSIRTLRLSLGGNIVSPEVQYYVQLAFANADYEVGGSASPLYDAWVQWTGLRDLNLRVGQFFVPFDRARTTVESSLQHVDRSTVVGEFNLDRDVGVELSSRDLFGLGGRLGYALGVFSGEGRNHAGAAPGFLYVARVQVSPFGAFDDNVEADLERLSRPRLAVGAAGAYNEATIRQRSTLGTQLTLGPFDYFHAAADVHFKWSGLSVLAEVLYRHATSSHHDAPPPTNPTMTRAPSEWSRSGWGYMAQAGYAFNAHFELAARYGQMFAESDTDPTLIQTVGSAGHELGGTVSWYIQGHAYKVQADYFAFFGDAVGSARQQVRLQLQASF